MNDDRTLLHAQIMNLPTRGPKGTIHTDDYLTGHRDARHAAADLVSAALSSSASEPVGEPTWPTTPEQVREFIGSNFNSMRPARGMEDGQLLRDVPADAGDTYSLTAHDLLSAFQHWADFASPLPQEVKALTPERIELLAKESGFGFFGQWLLWQGDTNNLLAFARAIEREVSGAQEASDLPVQWAGADGTSHEITLDYAARIAKWMFDTHGDVPQVDAVLARGAQEVKTGGWMPIESAPKDGTEVRLLYPNGDQRHGQWTKLMPDYLDHWSNGSGPRFGDDPTHWQPLPPPPSFTLAESTKGGQR